MTRSGRTYIHELSDCSWFNDTVFCRLLPPQPRQKELLHRFSGCFRLSQLPENLLAHMPGLRDWADEGFTSQEVFTAIVNVTMKPDA
jgi:hypothetical protein